MQTDIVLMLKEYLARKKISQTEIAEELGFTRSYISSLFTKGKMNTETYEAILKAADINVQDLFCQGTNSPSSVETQLEEIKMYVKEIHAISTQIPPKTNSSNS